MNASIIWKDRMEGLIYAENDVSTLFRVPSKSADNRSGVPNNKG